MIDNEMLDFFIEQIVFCLNFMNKIILFDLYGDQISLLEFLLSSEIAVVITCIIHRNSSGYVKVKDIYGSY